MKAAFKKVKKWNAFWPMTGIKTEVNRKKSQIVNNLQNFFLLTSRNRNLITAA